MNLELELRRFENDCGSRDLDPYAAWLATLPPKLRAMLTERIKADAKASRRREREWLADLFASLPVSVADGEEEEGE